MSLAGQRAETEFPLLPARPSTLAPHRTHRQIPRPANAEPHRYLLFAICYLLFAIRYSLFAIRYSLFAIRYSLFAIRTDAVNAGTLFQAVLSPLKDHTNLMILKNYTKLPSKNLDKKQSLCKF
ncbi:hypothetical protein QUF31_06050 [Dickeya chrysanthemi]|uniref:hypothetical protein n=1 Tax=Dickeya chrysanthemi TaxID=556 RepID=UPI0025A11D9A|nr:hypothetical protein [Dickeya chrysanthemi]WJM86668.1 hypothetical protein QUF31_06050 [Dickeya chrysanthemi]